MTTRDANGAKNSIAQRRRNLSIDLHTPSRRILLRGDHESVARRIENDEKCTRREGERRRTENAAGRITKICQRKCGGIAFRHHSARRRGENVRDGHRVEDIAAAKRGCIDVDV